MPRSRPTAGGLICSCSTCRFAMSRSLRRLEQQRRDAVEDADRDVLVDRLLVEQHGAAALGHQRDAGAPRRRRAGESPRPAGDRERAAIRLQLAEQDARQLELAAAHEAVDAEHLAGARLERDVLQAARQRELRRPSAPPAFARRAAARIVAVAVLERLAAVADHGLDQCALAGGGGRGLRDFPAVAEHGRRCRTRAGCPR